jgi:predicted MFS family arabinose efflux permease
MVLEASVVERDLRLILAVQALRAFAYGFSSVILGSSLAAGGLSATRVGFVFSAMLVGSAITSITIGVVGDHIGRRRLYTGLLLLMGMAGAVYALTQSLPVLVLVALTGTLSTDPNESGPITSLEQAMMGSAPREARARVFGRYNAVAYLAGALGALTGGGPALFRRWFPALPPDQRWLFAFPVVALACAAFAHSLSSEVETGHRPSRRPLQRSRRTVTKLAALFGLDAFAGGFIVQTFLVYWFERKFGAGSELLGLVFFAAGLLQAGSSIVAGRLGTRIGLLNTMVFTHLPSNVLLLAIPLMPSLGLAIWLLLARFALSQMDVPARQAYVVTMVDPEERTAAAAFTNTARYVARPFGAVGAGALMQATAIGAPFLLAGGIKIVYDLLIYGTFRRVPLPAEAATPRRPG